MGLLDGKRIVPSNKNSTIDISLFPQLLTQRADGEIGGAINRVLFLAAALVAAGLFAWRQRTAPSPLVPRGIEQLDRIRFEAQNPVFLIAATKP